MSREKEDLAAQIFVGVVTQTGYCEGCPEYIVLEALRNTARFASMSAGIFVETVGTKEISE